MTRWLLHIVLLLYPGSWRERYGSELDKLVGDLSSNRQRSLLRMVPDLLWGAVRERARSHRSSIVGVPTFVLAIAVAVGAG